MTKNNLENMVKEKIETGEEFSFEKELKNLPELLKGKNLSQNQFHELDVYDHTLLFVDFIKKFAKDNHHQLNPNMLAAAYLHDIGKPITVTEDIDRGPKGEIYHSFHNHEKVGADMIRQMPDIFFKQNNLDQERIATMVSTHMLPLKGIKKMRQAKNFEDFKKEYQELLETLDQSGLNREEIMELFLADTYAKGKINTDLTEFLKIKEAILSNNPDGKIKEIYQLQQEMYSNKKEAA